MVLSPVVGKDTTYHDRTTEDDKLCGSSNDQTGIIRHGYDINTSSKHEIMEVSSDSDKK
jgi:hypothetical protein